MMRMTLRGGLVIVCLGLLAACDFEAREPYDLDAVERVEVGDQVFRIPRRYFDVPQRGPRQRDVRLEAMITDDVSQLPPPRERLVDRLERGRQGRKVFSILIADLSPETREFLDDPDPALDPIRAHTNRFRGKLEPIFGRSYTPPPAAAASLGDYRGGGRFADLGTNGHLVPNSWS